MKYPLFLSLGLCLSLVLEPVEAQKPQIKSIRQENYQLAGDGKALNLFQKVEQQFSKSGQVLRQDYYEADTSGKLQPQKKIVNSYDAQGRHLNTLNYNADNNLETEVRMYWDDKDNKIKTEEISYAGGQQVAVAVTYLLEYDAKGNKKSEKNFDTDGRVSSIKTWEYNKLNEVTRTRLLQTPKNQPERSVDVRYKHDNKGNLLKSISVESVNRKEFRKDVVYFNNNYVVRWRKYLNGKFESEFFNEYRDSVIIRTTTHNRRKIISAKEDERYRRKMERQQAKKGARKNEEVWVTNTEYDAYGNILITTQSKDDKVMMLTQFAYDDYGNRTKVIKVDKEKNIKEEERFSYDTYGNVNVRTVLKNDRLQGEERFFYEYFGKD